MRRKPFDICHYSWKAERANRFPKILFIKNKLSDRMIKQLLNSVIPKYRDLLMSCRSIICLSLRLRQIIDLPATDKSRHLAQPRPIIANYSLRTLPELPLLPLFYRNVLSAWKSISKHTARTKNEIKNEILWNNHEVTIGGKSVFFISNGMMLT